MHTCFVLIALSRYIVVIIMGVFGLNLLLLKTENTVAK